MKLPEEFLQSLEGLPGFDREAFVAVHQAAQPPTSIRLNPAKPVAPEALFPSPLEVSPVPWSKEGRYLSQRPSFTFDPFFHAGCYYVQEASSMFLEQALRQLLPQATPLKVLDLCAAPGGKTTHIQSLLPVGSLLVSNETIKPRSVVLADNVIRWGCQNVLVSNNDPRAFAALPGYFDVLVVDAPCSGSGLFRKDEDAIAEWSLQAVALCSQRQQRILADALPTLKDGGLLVYSTCSYAAEEDEAILDWLVAEGGVESVGLEVSAFPGIVETQSPSKAARGYRFYPDKVNGEGFFLACFRKTSAQPQARLRPAKTELATAKERAVFGEWVSDTNLSFFRFREAWHALPTSLLPAFNELLPVLNLRYLGVQVGEIMKNRLVPAHALAQSAILRADVPAASLSLDDAIRYLQRQELLEQPTGTGWQVAQYRGQSLGWMNVLPNRVNNYYPKEIRILKQQNNTSFKN